MALVDQKIPGKCPKCAGADPTCDTCKGSGEVAFGFARGFMFTKHCNACGQENGIAIRDTRELEGQQVNHGNSMGAPVGPPDDAPIGCVWCRDPDVVWKLLGRTDDE